MKTLLVSVNSKFIHSSLAVWYLKASVTNERQNVQILESTIKENKQKLIERISNEKADVIAFSCYIWNINFVSEILPTIKENNPNITIVLGGPEVSYNCNEVFEKNAVVDYILSGEGEEVLPDFLDALLDNRSPNGLIGVNSRTCYAVPHTSQNEPPRPYTAEYLERLNGRITYIETSRGCPYSCSYCLSGRLCKIKFFDLDRVKSDIDLLSNSGTQTIKFVDRTFNCNPKRAYEIIKYIVEKKPVFTGLCFHFEIAGDIITDEIIDILSKAPVGLIQIEVGVQSFNEKTLELVNRKTDIAKLTRNVKKIIDNNNVHVHMDLIAGLPCENYESFKASFNKLFELRPHKLQLGFLKLLHGSPMKEQDVGKFSENAPYEIIENKYLSVSDLDKLKCVEDALERLYNSDRFKFLLEKIFGIREDAFEVFLDFGLKHKAIYGTKLDDYCASVLEYFQKYMDKEKLTDILKEQWLMFNSSGKLPYCLNDNAMGFVLKTLDKDIETKRKKGIKRGATRLVTTGEYIWVDYENKHPVTGLYLVNRRIINCEETLNN